MEEKYVLMIREYSGNSHMFWKEGRAGYTANIEEAHQFTMEEAIKTNKAQHAKS